jgi:hypothetical protein
MAMGKGKQSFSAGGGTPASVAVEKSSGVLFSADLAQLRFNTTDGLMYYLDNELNVWVTLDEWKTRHQGE